MRNIFGLVFIVFSIQMHAQIAADALRYSFLEVGGTARTVGIGGGIGALGADYSVLSTNPAGLAAFRTNEFVFTPSVFNSKTTSLLENGSGNSANIETSTSFNMNNIGMILNNRPRGRKWTTFNFGIGFNRLATFNQEYKFEGNSSGSLVDRYTELANDGLFDEFEVIPAESAGAIIFNETTESYENDFSFVQNYEGQKEQLVKTKGSYSELVFAFGGNYDEKLMIGATIGVPFLSFEEEKIYEESDEADEVPLFNDLEFQENLTTSGVGINLKIGVIYRINQMFRLGAAFHTPTAMSLTDNFSTQLTYDYTLMSGERFNDPVNSPEGTFEYKLRTPWRAIGSAAVLINRKGFISADVEYVDYSKSKFNLTSDSDNIEDQDYEIDLNNSISDDYQSAINIRVGGEYALDVYRFRAGYSISGTPYADSNITNNAYSLGVGYRKRTFYIDLAYKKSQIEEEYVPYLLANPTQEQSVNNKVNNSQFLLTAGFKF